MKTLIRLLLQEQSDLGLHCLPRPICPKNIGSLRYCKSPKFSDTQNICCNHTKIQIKMSFQSDICPKGADGMANSVDPDQTAPIVLIRLLLEQSDLGLHCLLRLVCPKT